MSPLIYQWAARHGITLQAINELQVLFGMLGGNVMPEAATGTSESAVQAVVRLEAGRNDCRLWRNNVGVLTDATGRPVRYGLANDSPALNRVVKSADLIGWRRVIITPEHVGKPIAQFLSRECKEVGWKYKNTEREQAQLAWAQLVIKDGGDAMFCTGEGTL
jgi:hypothetical protein